MPCLLLNILNKDVIFYHTDPLGISVPFLNYLEPNLRRKFHVVKSGSLVGLFRTLEAEGEFTPDPPVGPETGLGSRQTLDLDSVCLFSHRK